MSAVALERTTLRTSRLLDFGSEKELVAQIGHSKDAWPAVIAKELLDNGIDAVEEAGTPPVITVTVDRGGITVEDNGPGIPADVVEDILDSSVRVSSREAYVSPTRGAQGNALKTVLAMPFVLDGHRGLVEIEAQCTQHIILRRRPHPPAPDSRAPRRARQCRNRDQDQGDDAPPIDQHSRRRLRDHEASVSEGQRQ
jgi:hypothetical protein